jgi:hypothetical protein
MTDPRAPLRAFALNCTLKPGPEASSTDVLLDQVGAEMARHGAVLERERVVDHHVAFRGDRGRGRR